MQPEQRIVHLGPANCALCDYPHGVWHVAEQRVEHHGWICYLATGVAVSRGAARSPRNLAEAHRRRQRLARRVRIAGRMVAAHLPYEMHGTRTARKDHGCECAPCRASDVTYQMARKRGKAA